MSKKKIYTFLSIIGLIAFVVFLIIAYSPVETRTLPETVIGVTCFFVFLMIGIPAFILRSNPDEISFITHASSKK